MMQCENADNRDSCINNCWSEVAHSALLTSLLQNSLLAFFKLRFAKRWHEPMEQLFWGFFLYIDLGELFYNNLSFLSVEIQPS